MPNSEHLATVMVEEFIRAVELGVDLVPVVADSTSTAKIKPFAEKFPNRLVNVGIAEQVMLGTAAGLALGGKVAVTCNAAPFLISRANEQVKVDVCYNNTNVKCFGLNAGASYGPLASTHHSIDDISVMRGFGNIEIYAPGSPEQCRQIIRYAIDKVGPVYIRLDGKALPEVMSQEYRFKPGAIDVLASGQEVVLVAMGSTLHEIVDAAAKLELEGISVGVIGVPSIRPCDTKVLAEELSNYTSAITVEEHNINGGLGSLVAEIIAENRLAVGLKRLGIKDGGYAIAADRMSMRRHHGFDSKSICDDVKQLLNTHVETIA